MLTPSGWLLAIGSALLGGAGRIIGSDELLAVGVAGAAVAALSVAYVRHRRPLRVLSRTLEPRPMNVGVHVGDECHVSIEMSNPGRLRSPVLRLADEVAIIQGPDTQEPSIQGSGAALGPGRSFESPDLLVAPVRAGGGVTVAYRLPTEERGRVVVGPLKLTVTDPLGMSARHFQLGGQAETLVYPAMSPIGPPPQVPGTSLGAIRRSPVSQSGEELYGLRPFQRGDDPRRIHWRSSAHHDELIVRQLEEVSHTRTTVLLDARSELVSTQTESGGLDQAGARRERFEAMVSAAASICRASQRRGDHVRLVTTEGFDSGYGPNDVPNDASDSAHLHQIFKHLALLSPGSGALADAVERLGRVPGGGLLVAVAGAIDETEHRSLNPLGSQFDSKTVVLFTAEGAAFQPARSGDTTVLAIDRPEGFRAAWASHPMAGKEPVWS